MVAELSALQQIINVLTGFDGTPVVIVECLVTSIYTCGYRSSSIRHDPVDAADRIG